MSKNIGLVVAALILIIALLGGAFYLKLSKSSKAPQKTAVSEEKTTVESRAKSTIKSLLGTGKNVTCTITYPNNKGKGTVYISDKKFRGDFTMQSDGKEVEGHTIGDGVFSYIWSSLAPTGIKMKIEETEKNASSEAQTGSVNLSEEGNFECSNWSVDNSKFTLPTNIKFTDFTQMMKVNTTDSKAGTQTTSPCDQITDPTAKAACVKALGGGN